MKKNYPSEKNCLWLGIDREEAIAKINRNKIVEEARNERNRLIKNLMERKKKPMNINKWL